MRTKWMMCIWIFLAMVMMVAADTDAAMVVHKDGRTYIKDQHGELWDVTQAESLGFSPRKFQYGIGRNAFRPLDASHLTSDTKGLAPGARVIGVADGSTSQAYSVSRLRYHEIANTALNGKPITVGY